MGQLHNGRWVPDAELSGASGSFQRQPTKFHGAITADDSSPFPAQPGRYHLYVAYACPWAHRTLLFRHLKGLDDMITVSVVSPLMGDNGWTFAQDGDPDVIPDTVNDARYLHEVYVKGEPEYSGRASTPVLWDRKTNRIVNNESLEIIQMFDSAFDTMTGSNVRFFPLGRQDEVAAMIQANYEAINNGVYRCGFAGSQQAYEEAFGQLFARLDSCERILERQRYLCGNTITAADWCLFVTLYRFDSVYYVHFKCNLRRIVEYPNLWGYVRDLYQMPGVAATCHMRHIKEHYYRSHESINPRGIVPIGPDIDFMSPHDRDRFTAT